MHLISPHSPSLIFSFQFYYPFLPFLSYLPILLFIPLFQHAFFPLFITLFLLHSFCFDLFKLFSFYLLDLLFLLCGTIFFKVIQFCLDFSLPLLLLLLPLIRTNKTQRQVMVLLFCHKVRGRHPCLHELWYKRLQL